MSLDFLPDFEEVEKLLPAMVIPEINLAVPFIIISLSLELD